MNTTTIFIIVVLAVVVLGLLALIGGRNKTTDQHPAQLNNEYALPVNNMGDGIQSQTGLDEQQDLQEHLEPMTTHVVSDNDNGRNLTE